MPNSAKKSRVKASEDSIPTATKGPEVYKDVDWRNLNVLSTETDNFNRLVSLISDNWELDHSYTDEEAKSLEKEGSLAWKVLTNTQMQTLMLLPVEELQMRLAELLGLSDHATFLRDAVLLDFYVSAFWWGREQGWSVQQISGLITVHHRLADNLGSRSFTPEENLDALRKMLVGVGTKDDQNGGLDFLDIPMATSMVEYISSTFFQHYRLYEFLFTEERTEEVISTDVGVELVPPATLPHPPPLDEGLPEALYLRHVAPPPPVEPEDPPASTGTPQDESKETIDVEESKPHTRGDVVQDILAGVTAEDIQTIFDSVSKELFSSLQNDVAAQLKERESEIVGRINRIHCIMDT